MNISKDGDSSLQRASPAICSPPPSTFALSCPPHPLTFLLHRSPAQGAHPVREGSTQFRTLEEIRHKTRHLVPKDLLGSMTEGWPVCETASSYPLPRHRWVATRAFSSGLATRSCERRWCHPIPTGKAIKPPACRRLCRREAQKLRVPFPLLKSQDRTPSRNRLSTWSWASALLTYSERKASFTQVQACSLWWCCKRVCWPH